MNAGLFQMDQSVTTSLTPPSPATRGELTDTSAYGRLRRHSDPPRVLALLQQQHHHQEEFQHHHNLPFSAHAWIMVLLARRNNQHNHHAGRHPAGLAVLPPLAPLSRRKPLHHEQSSISTTAANRNSGLHGRYASRQRLDAAPLVTMPFPLTRTSSSPQATNKALSSSQDFTSHIYQYSLNTVSAATSSHHGQSSPRNGSASSTAVKRNILPAVSSGRPVVAAPAFKHRARANDARSCCLDTRPLPPPPLRYVAWTADAILPDVPTHIVIPSRWPRPNRPLNEKSTCCNHVTMVDFGYQPSQTNTRIENLPCEDDVISELSLDSFWDEEEELLFANFDSLALVQTTVSPLRPSTGKDSSKQRMADLSRHQEAGAVSMKVNSHSIIAGSKSVNLSQLPTELRSNAGRIHNDFTWGITTTMLEGGDNMGGDDWPSDEEKFDSRSNTSISETVASNPNEPTVLKKVIHLDPHKNQLLDMALWPVGYESKSTHHVGSARSTLIPHLTREYRAEPSTARILDLSTRDSTSPVQLGHLIYW